MFRFLLAPLLVSVSLAGCSANPLQSSAEAEESATSSNQANVDQQQASPPIKTTPLTGQSFYQLLLAEIATNRREYGTAAELYSRLAQAQDDTEVIRRATALNQVVSNYERMQTHAQQWTTQSPETQEAWQALSIASVANADFATAETAMNRWLELNPKAEIETTLIGAQGLDTAQQQELVSLLRRLFDRFAQNSSLPLTLGQALISQGSVDSALPFVREARALEDSPAKGLLEYRILLELEEIDAARATLEELAAKYPKNGEVATAYASFAYADGQDDKTEVLKSLFNRFPNEPVIVRAFARESFDNEDYDTAEALFNRLLDTEFDDEAHYFLGRINKENARPELAADHFLNVSKPPYLVSALAELGDLWYQDRMSDLQVELQQARENFPERGPLLWRIEADAYRSRGESDQAFMALEQGLSAHPDNTDLLYDQALLAANLGRYEVMEDNLKAVLKQDPDHASALNALGYTWADRNENLEQAAEYIDRALELRPDDPAIMDSKGWLEYRLGNYEAAEEWLRKAVKAFDNDEVAAHLAEVLWVTDQQEEAREWLRHAFELNPNSPTAEAVVKKFEVEL